MRQPPKKFAIYQREHFLENYLRQEEISQGQLAKRANVSTVSLWRADNGYQVGGGYIGNIVNATKKDFNEVFYIAERKS